MNKRLILGMAGLGLVATLVFAASRRPKGEPVGTLTPDGGISLRRDAVSKDDVRVIHFTVKLGGGGAKNWVTESCNPVFPIVKGKPTVTKQCFTNFYSKEVLRAGKGETLEFDWFVDHPDSPLKPGQKYRLGVALATDCEKKGGPGLFAMGNCKTTRIVKTKEFTVSE